MVREEEGGRKGGVAFGSASPTPLMPPPPLRGNWFEGGLKGIWIGRVEKRGRRERVVGTGSGWGRREGGEGKREEDGVGGEMEHPRKGESREERERDRHIR